MINPQYQNSNIDVRGLFESFEPARVTGRASWRSGDRPVTVGYSRLRLLERALDVTAQCLVESLLVAATARGVQVFRVEARIDVNAPAPRTPGGPSLAAAGPERATVTLRIDSPANKSTIARLVVEARNASPMFDLVSSGLTVELRHEKV